MSIPNRVLREAGSSIRDRLTSLLTRTITGKPLVLTPVSPGSVQLSFRDQGIATSTVLNTKYGSMDLFIGQTYDAVQGAPDDQPRLRMLSYRYTLRPFEMIEPLFRWEYIAFPGEDAVYCRHHLQGRISFEVTDQRGRAHAISLNDWHLPTGWTSVEEVIRFCIVDLGVTPLSDE